MQHRCSTENRIECQMRVHQVKKYAAHKQILAYERHILSYKAIAIRL